MKSCASVPAHTTSDLFGRLAHRLHLADVSAQTFIEEVDDGADSRRVADALVCEQPEYSAVIVSRRNALDEVRIGIRDDARQNRDPEA